MTSELCHVYSVAKILKAIIVFRGLIAERVVVRGFNEPGTLDNGLIDIWTQSKVSKRIYAH